MNEDVIDYIKEELLLSPEVEFQWVCKITNLAKVDDQMYRMLSTYMAETDEEIRRHYYRKMKLFYEDYFSM